MGTPEFLHQLDKLKDVHEVALVVTQPDRPSGSYKLTPPPVKVVARRLVFPVIQPDKVNTPEVMQS